MNEQLSKILLSKNYSTSQLSEIIGIHKNTLIWYETAEYLRPVNRLKNSYRSYSTLDGLHALFINQVFKIHWIPGKIRKLSFTLLKQIKKEDFEAASGSLVLLGSLLSQELDLANEAVQLIHAYSKRQWASQDNANQVNPINGVGGAADLLSVTAETIRFWERSNLIQIPRKENGYRFFTSLELSRLKIIRFCRLAGYSVTAINRVLRFIDKNDKTNLSTIEDHINTPSDFEKDFFSTFPTDSWISSIQNALNVHTFLVTLLYEIKSLSL